VEPKVKWAQVVQNRDSPSLPQSCPPLPLPLLQLPLVLLPPCLLQPQTITSKSLPYPPPLISPHGTSPYHSGQLLLQQHTGMRILLIFSTHSKKIPQTFSHSTISSKIVHMKSKPPPLKNPLHTWPHSPRSSPSSPVLSTAISMGPSVFPHTSASASPSISPSQPLGNGPPSSAVTMVPPLLPISPTKPVPPPASQPRRKNLLASQTVVYPPKESCSKCVGSGVPSVPPR